MSLVEVMIAVSILSVGLLGFVSAFGFITKSIQYSRARSLAVNLAQEKIENLKNIPYYKLQLSTSVTSYDQFDPHIVVDNENYPPEEVVISNIRFTRGVAVALAEVSDHYVNSTSYNYPDTGLKFVTVYVWWQQAGEWKHVELSNVYENPNVAPLNSVITGTVSDTLGNPVPNALVKVVENPDWNDYSAADGVYTVQAQAGTYTLRVSSGGYYDGSALNQMLQSGLTTTKDFTLTAIGVGTLTGNVWINKYPVISQIVVATNTAVGGPWMPDPPLTKVEYIELFNPTTYTINVAQGGGGAPVNQYLKLRYVGKNAGLTVEDHGVGVKNFDFTYVSTHIPPGRYYLMASATWFMVRGEWLAADAYYGALHSDYLLNNDAGILRLENVSGLKLDKVAWLGDYDGVCGMDWSQYEYYPLLTCDWYSNPYQGIGEGNQAVRLSSPALPSDTYGKAYNSQVNYMDFTFPLPGCGWCAANYPEGINYKPRNTTAAAQAVITGIPGAGAYVTADDLIGPSAQAPKTWYSHPSGAWWGQYYAPYTLSGVSTGTWNVIIASGSYYMQVSSVMVKQNTSTGTIQTGSSPGYIVGSHDGVMLSSSSVLGFLTGSVTDVNALPISNIIVRASGSGDKTTNGAGRYFAQVSSGPITATFNPGNANGIFVEYVTQPSIVTGQVTTQDAILTQGGTLTGYMTTDGNSILPNIKVAATKGGLEYGVGTSDSSGYFYIRNLSTGVYNVAPVLDPLEICTPASVSTRVASVSTLFVSTFVVTGAQGKLAGTVKYNNELIHTGALILVSTGTLSDTPPTLSAIDSPAKQVIYAASSEADGTYEVEVRGSAQTYNVKVYYPVASATGATVVKKSYTATVSGSATTPLDLSLP